MLIIENKKGIQVKKTLLGNKLKFIMLLSITSVLGIQESHAAQVKCPDPSTITLSKGGDGNPVYTGSTTGARTIPLSLKMFPNHSSVHFSAPAVAVIEGDGLMMSCIYENGITLSTLDVNAIKGCSTVPNNQDYFDCQ